MNLSVDAQRLLEWMGPISARSLQEIMDWGPFEKASAEQLRRVCGELVEAGKFSRKVSASGETVYGKSRIAHPALPEEIADN